MLRHQGLKRSFKHNLQLAIMLSWVAGFVNAAGLVAFTILTTNITGHAASLAVDASFADMRGVRLAGFCLLLFFAGTLFSSWYINMRGKDKRYVYTVPLLIEMAILAYVALYGYTYDGSMLKKEHFAGSLLFAMGMQNALVTMVSKSVVRTTHLTGMITDFGIAVAEVIREKFRIRKILKHRLLLHVNIIFFFLFGGVIGAFLFVEIRYYSFFVPALMVLFTAFFDAFRLGVAFLQDRLFYRRRSSSIKR